MIGRRWMFAVIVGAAILFTGAGTASGAPSTGENVGAVFQDFYNRSGGVAVFGYPISATMQESGYTVQYFERQRMEYHPELAGTPYSVVLGLLGQIDADSRGLLETDAFKPLPTDMTPDSNCVFFSATGHQTCAGFKTYWQSHGVDLGDSGTSYRESLALFGYPISEEFTDPSTGFTVQYFQRARFEYHPENQASENTVLLGLLGASVAQYQGGGSRHSTSVSPKVASPGVYLGVWQPGAPWNMTALDQFERETGKHVAIVHWYQGWGAANSALNISLLSSVSARGSVPMITWEPWDYTKGADQPEYNLANIANGNFDSYIRSWANGLSAYQKPVLLRFAHEMNNPVYPWSIGVNGNTPDQYVAAWRHVHDIFAAAGATNVQWIWSPNVWWEGQPDIEPMYPGDGYVDWVAMDGYNYVAWGGWKSFSQIFGPTYQKLTALTSKPVMVAEVASDETGGSKADWITSMYTNEIPAQFPRIKAVVWFNEKRDANWPVGSSSQALKAYSRAVSSSKYVSAWP